MDRISTQIPGSGAVAPSSPMPQEGSMTVVLRVRPPSRRERAAPRVLHVLDQHEVLLSLEEPGGAAPPARSPGRRRRNLKFVFDHVFTEGATQEEVFQHTTLPLLDSLLAGYNCSVFAYGASGVGKTHTMVGSKSSPGIVHLATVELYKRLEAMKDKSWEVLVSYQQVYKECVYDMLEPGSPLNVWEQPGKGAVAHGLSFHKPTSAEQLLDMLAKGSKNRAQRHTKANATSSRSHAIFQIQVKQWDTSGGPAGDSCVAKLSFIDLAGSGRAWDTPSRGQGLREATSISRSLLALKSVVRALTGARGRQSHVPFRDSKLTRLLKDSLGSSCRCTVIAAVSPAAPAGPDTCNTLRFASRARHILLPSLQLQCSGMSLCSSRTESLPDLQFQASTPSPLLQELSGHQEQNLCPDEMSMKTKEVEILALEESIGSVEALGLEESSPPCSPTEPSEAAPAPGMQLSCAAEAPVAMPDPAVPSPDPECFQELSPCSSFRSMSPGPVKSMLESSTDSQSENSRSSRARRKRQQSPGKAAGSPRAAQSPPVSPGPRCVSLQPSPPGTPSPGTPAAAAARSPSSFPGPAPSAEQQQPELRAALPHPPPSTSPRVQTPNAFSSSRPRSSCSPASIRSCPAMPSCPPVPSCPSVSSCPSLPSCPPVLPWPRFRGQLRAPVRAPSAGSVLFVCLQVMGGFRE
ncbi:kinesin-like protein KIF18B isoform X1 [Poecile atricapillus]|uniref:kinesin-like protein KIF18B isoform X1 n=1 Tax=Poecile atricapillus TaxID=48891 RepID=UPI0027383453|nr:kinesin-like protein KIF18B isoform X1 [Poecile atricapillus]